MKEKASITAAITGSIYTPAMSPYLPITPKQIADEAVAAANWASNRPLQTRLERSWT
jgi:uncharacterized protein (DUF849 family)